MSSAKAKALPAFPPLTGSDNTSFFSGTGKKSAYATWSTRPELTTTLCHLMNKPETPSSDDIAVIESFVISLYSVSCTLMDVNKACQQIFAQSSRTFEYLPSPKAALVEHIKRTTHQGLWALQSSCYVALKLTTFLSCSMHTTTSTEHSIIIYCMLLLYTIVIIVLHIHTRAGTCSNCNDTVVIMVIPDTVWGHF